MAEDNKATTEQVDQGQNALRTELRRVIIDTPALLNMIKHCREMDVA